MLPFRLLRFHAALACGLLVMAGCARPLSPGDPPAPAPALLAPVAVSAALLDDADPGSLRQAVGQSLAWLEGIPPDSLFDYGVRRVTAQRLADAFRGLDAFLATDPAPADLSAWVLARFDPLAAADRQRPGDALVTGYFEPVIAGAPERTERARVPVHARPDDLVTVRLPDFRAALPDERVAGRVQDGRLVPYFSRREIQEEGALDGRGLEVAWVESRVDLFFLEVQGSGAIRFPDGREMRVGFAAGNGHPYRSIGRLLIDEGHVPAEQMSMQAIRAYLEAHPEEVSRVLNHNPSYVFFRELDTPPLGFLGVPVTAGRSIATDYRLFPGGALAFLETTRPTQDASGRVTEGAPLRRFVLNQDTGGAIRGSGRVDFFWGRGDEAAHLAGLMQQRGRLLILVPKE